MWTRKGLRLFCLLLLLWVLPVSCLANEKPLMITEEQLQIYEQSSQELQMLIEASKLTTTSSAQKILSLEKSLTALRLGLKKATDLQKESARIIEKQDKTLKLQEKLLNESSEIIRKLEAKIAKLERNSRTGIYSNTTSAGLFQTHRNLMVTVGQKWNGGIEVGAGIVLVVW